MFPEQGQIPLGKQRASREGGQKVRAVTTNEKTLIRTLWGRGAKADHDWVESSGEGLDWG